jgi:hypothetical protein
VALSGTALASQGLLAIGDYLTEYAGSPAFGELSAETNRLTAGLAKVRYLLLIKGASVTVSRYTGDEADYSATIEETFARFRQGAAKDYRIGYESPPEMNHLETAILERVAGLFPDSFAALRRFGDRYPDFIDPTIADFDREVQFYLAYLDYLAPLKSAGLPFCYPVVESARSIRVTGTFDLALAAAIVPGAGEVVRNDFHLEPSERIVVVTGPNQGGKTTFARTFGQLHHLAALGLPVPGDAARLVPFDHLLTHFGKEEDLGDLRGKLQDDLVTTVDPVDPAIRTYRVERRPADGLAYAAAIATKYGLTYQQLKDRLSR